MTPLRIISEAISGHDQVPWGGIFASYPVLYNEFKAASSVLQAIDHDPMAGLSISGLNTGLTNLAYLCYKVLVDIGGRKTLSKYQGVGSPSSNPPMALTIDKLLMEIMNEVVTVNYAQIKESSQKIELKSSSYYLSVAKFLTAPDQSEDESQDDLLEEPTANPSRKN